MKVAVLFSGAKDSTFALYRSIQEGHEIKCLLTMLPENPESYMFHHPNVKWTGKQAVAMGIQMVTKETAGKKEQELQDVEDALKGIKGIEGVVSGAIASEYQRSRIGTVCDKIGLESLTPLWGTDQEKHWDNVLEAGFRVMMVSVACDGLGREWLGRVIDRNSLKELKRLAEKHRFNAAGEGGEFETFVLDGPVFKKRLEVASAETVWDRDSGFYLIKELRIKQKTRQRIR